MSLCAEVPTILMRKTKEEKKKNTDNCVVCKSAVCWRHADVVLARYAASEAYYLERCAKKMFRADGN